MPAQVDCGVQQQLTFADYSTLESSTIAYDAGSQSLTLYSTDFEDIGIYDLLVSVSSDDYPKENYPLMAKEVFFTIRILGCDIETFYWTEPVTALTYEIGTGKKDFELEKVYPTCGSLPIRYSVIDIDYSCCLSVTNSGKEIQV